MPSTTSLGLIAIGAILRYAVTAHVSGVNLSIVGLVLMIVGVLGLILSLVELAVWAPRRRERAAADSYRTVEQRY